ncbi:protein BRE4 [Kluyveromyces marxianus]|uniref:Protein BRE4 n=2 Tax=Kluyveromyces marxianus TaxID=4911 RepID=W0TCU9_KLUMD|nr:protein BRE4 [Kluyveromyces marxianus DMKU3-1042]QGN16955.1 protein BRE4 [Kluyveromyces marxianus]BAO41250.1 protein BRE4 [Kluyveromyces marxianus DMKU3-1042]BAP72698.1 protein BRE4 [Kluyveromyces marxianus]
MTNLQGSYDKKSYLSVTGLRAAKYGRDSKTSCSRVNLSQMKLDKLMEGKKWEELETFGLEELRNGFFDPVYTGYERIIPSDPLNKEKVHQKSLFPSTDIKEIRKFWKPIMKYCIAIFIANVLCLIEPAGSWFGGDYRYFLPLALLIHHPVRTVGVQCELTIQSIIGGAVGMGYSALIWYVSTATEPAAKEQGGILFLGLFLGAILAHWVRSTYQRLFYLSTSFGIAVLFFCGSSLSLNKKNLSWKLYWDFGISYLFGLLLSLLVCCSVFPHSCHSTVKNTLVSALEDIKILLTSLVDSNHCDDTDRIREAQHSMIQNINISLSEGLREFSNQATITIFDPECLKELRNIITFTTSPLRVLPLKNVILTRSELDRFLHEGAGLESPSPREGSADSPMVISGAVTPLPSAISPTTPIDIDAAIYSNILRSSFAKAIFQLIREMLLVLENTQYCMEVCSTFFVNKNDIEEAKSKLEKLQKRLRRKIYKLDVTYKEFTKTDFFCKDLLQDPNSIDAFLFLRYIRQSAKSMIALTERTVDLINNRHFRICLPNYPLKRSLTRLPNQCALDQGGDTVLHYFETKRDVDEAFEKIYNSYTSKHKYNDGKGKNFETYTRAIDHNDFNFHTTTNPIRFKLWQLTTVLTGPELKSSLKVAFILTFLLLPSWLKESHVWYDSYHCWWGPAIFFILTNRRNVATWKGILRRFLYGVFSIVWAFCGCVSRHNSPYVIATFGAILSVPLAINFFVNKNTKSSFTALACFDIIALGIYAKGDGKRLHTSMIWKNTWITGIALLIGVLLSIPTTWLIWSFKTRRELRLAMSSLLSHISQSYQSVTDRYLYRDIDDDPTDLTLRLSNIREVRLFQSLIAARNLLERAKQEPNYISNFKPYLYEDLIDNCMVLLEKVIEARISGQYFEVWENDADEEITHALLSLRRDSVSSVIFVFYILSNCFRSKNKIPKYLPNPMLSRKKLYDFINKFESLRKSQLENSTSPFKKSYLKSNYAVTKDIEKTHWTEVHGMAFSRAYTDFTFHLDRVVKLSREILGEETI